MKVLTTNIGETIQNPDEIKMKSRAIITNNEGKILIANYGGVYLLPGGSIDDAENPNDTIIRELREETGLEFQELEPFAKIKYFQNSYPTREGKTIDRLLITYYYIGRENDAIKHDRKLTEKEIKDGFELKYYSVEEIESILEQNKTENPRNEYFNKEIKTIIEHYRKEKMLSNRIIKPVQNEYIEKSIELVEKVFTEFKNKEEGKMVRKLVEEIRSKNYYIPELDLMAVDENGEIIGYALFSRFHLEGKFENELLILTPVAVKTNMQRQHISKDIIEYGFEKAKEMGFTAVLVEGNPDNYKSRGFVTSSDYGIIPGPNIKLPKIECLMIKELVPGTLGRMNGIVDYSFYKTLSEEQER